MTDSFWAGGGEAYATVLADFYEPQLANLRKRRNEIGVAERIELDAELKRLEKEYMEKLKSIDDSVF